MCHSLGVLGSFVTPWMGSPCVPESKTGKFLTVRFCLFVNNGSHFDLLGSKCLIWKGFVTLSRLSDVNGIFFHFLELFRLQHYVLAFVII